jgi:hypothetical protein
VPGNWQRPPLLRWRAHTPAAGREGVSREPGRPHAASPRPARAAATLSPFRSVHWDPLAPLIVSATPVPPVAPAAPPPPMHPAATVTGRLAPSSPTSMMSLGSNLQQQNRQISALQGDAAPRLPRAGPATHLGGMVAASVPLPSKLTSKRSVPGAPAPQVGTPSRLAGPRRSKERRRRKTRCAARIHILRCLLAPGTRVLPCQRHPWPPAPRYRLGQTAQPAPNGPWCCCKGPASRGHWAAVHRRAVRRSCFARQPSPQRSRGAACAGRLDTAPGRCTRP